MGLDELLSTATIFPFPNCCCGLTPGEQFSVPGAAKSDNVTNAPSEKATMPCASPGTCCNRIYSLSQLLDTLPPKETCDELYRNFLDNIHPITPLLHIPTFQSQYIRFWQWFLSWDRQKIPSGLLAETPSFLPLLFAVFFAGSFGVNTVLSNQDANGSFPTTTTSLYKSHSHALALVSFPQSPTIYSLIAYLLAQNILIREDSLSSCSFVSVALRIAQAMGLNRDGAYFKLDPIQAEVRRRVWWHIIHTDIMTCFPCGLPPLIVDDDHYDTRMISELQDEYIGSSAIGPSPYGVTQDSTELGCLQNTASDFDRGNCDDEKVDICHVVAVGRYRLTTLMRKILRRQFNVLPMSVKDIMALKKAVDEQSSETAMRIKQIGAMQFRSMESSQQDHWPGSTSSRQPRSLKVSAFQAWAQKLLRLLIHKAYCILYQPLLKGVYGGLNSRIRKE
jgi:hypothetical protein